MNQATSRVLLQQRPVMTNGTRADLWYMVVSFEPLKFVLSLCLMRTTKLVCPSLGLDAFLKARRCLDMSEVGIPKTQTLNLKILNPERRIKPC